LEFIVTSRVANWIVKLSAPQRSLRLGVKMTVAIFNAETLRTLRRRELNLKLMRETLLIVTATVRKVTLDQELWVGGKAKAREP